MTTTDLPNVWRLRADLFRTHAADAQAATLEAAAAELENALHASREEALQLTTAAAESGYSTSQLRRMIREGTLPNAGKAGAPRVLRSDLPRKPGHNVDAATSAGLSSKRQIARAVAAGR